MHWVKAAQECDLTLRQKTNREGLPVQAHARCLANASHARRPDLSRFERQFAKVSAAQLPAKTALMARVKRILTQQRKDINKLYALHAPEVECIAKGKAKTPYEFGIKLSIVTTLKEELMVGARSMPGNPYDVHTLHEALEQAEIVSTSGRKWHLFIVATRAPRSTVYRFGNRVSDAVSRED